MGARTPRSNRAYAEAIAPAAPEQRRPSVTPGPIPRINPVPQAPEAPRRDVRTRTQTMPAIPARRPPRGWSVMIAPVAGTGTVRQFTLKRWQIRSAVAGLVFLVLGSVAGGIMMGSMLDADEIEESASALAEADVQLTALDDTVRALRIAAAPAAGAASSTDSRGTTVAAAPLAPRIRRTLSLGRLRPVDGVVLPVTGLISSGFARARFHPLLKIWRAHKGIDIVASSGTPITAAAAGTVVSVRWSIGFGRMVEIDHGSGVHTVYGHLRSATVSEGEHVGAGGQIGTVGSSGLATGPHLHYEVHVRGVAVDPLRNPLPGPGVSQSAAPAATPTPSSPAAPEPETSLEP